MDYSVTNGTSARTGTVMVITDGTDVEMTDFATGKIGTEATEPEFSAVISGSNVVVRITDASGYTVNKLIRRL